MIYFDRTTASLLRRIYRSGSKGVLWSKLQKRFGNEYDDEFFLHLSALGYTVNKEENRVIDPGSDDLIDTSNYKAFITNMGAAFIQERSYNFWKWTIPIVISTASFVISALTLLSQPRS